MPSNMRLGDVCSGCVWTFLTGEAGTSTAESCDGGRAAASVLLISFILMPARAVEAEPGLDPLVLSWSECALNDECGSFWDLALSFRSFFNLSCACICWSFNCSVSSSSSSSTSIGSPISMWSSMSMLIVGWVAPRDAGRVERVLEGDGDEERWASICLYRSRPPGVLSRASRGDRGGQ